MPDVALKAGIAWKNALVQANLTYVQEKEPGNTALIQRYKDELEILKRQNRRAYDLVKRNLDRVLRNEEESLAAYEGYVAHKDAISRNDRETLAGLRKVIEELKKFIRDLENEGPPP